MTWRLFFVVSAIVGVIVYFFFVHIHSDAEKVKTTLMETSEGYQAMNDGRGYRL